MSNNCTIDCPYCGKAVDIIQGMELEAGNGWTALIADLPPSMIGALLRYLELFKPKKQALRWSRRLALTQEIMPMIKSGLSQGHCMAILQEASHTMKFDPEKMNGTQLKGTEAYFKSKQCPLTHCNCLRNS